MNSITKKINHIKKKKKVKLLVHQDNKIILDPSSTGRRPGLTLWKKTYSLLLSSYTRVKTITLQAKGVERKLDVSRQNQNAHEAL